MRTLCILVAVTLVCLRCSTAVRASEDLSVWPLDKLTSVVGGEEAKFRYSVRTPDGLDGQIQWSLSVKEQVVQQGQFLLALAAARGAEAVVTVKMPEVKEGEVLEAQLSLTVHPEGEQRVLAKLVRTIRIVPRDRKP